MEVKLELLLVLDMLLDLSMVAQEEDLSKDQVVIIVNVFWYFFDISDSRLSSWRRLSTWF